MVVRNPIYKYRNIEIQKYIESYRNELEVSWVGLIKRIYIYIPDLERKSFLSNLVPLKRKVTVALDPIHIDIYLYLYIILYILNRLEKSD